MAHKFNTDLKSDMLLQGNALRFNPCSVRHHHISWDRGSTILDDDMKWLF